MSMPRSRHIRCNVNAEYDTAGGVEADVLLIGPENDAHRIGAVRMRL